MDFNTQNSKQMHLYNVKLVENLSQNLPKRPKLGNFDENSQILTFSAIFLAKAPNRIL